jgi:hypothetical protein
VSAPARFAALVALALMACAARPVLYPHHSGKGGTTDPEAQRAIDQCLELAKRDVGPGSNTELARQTAEEGAVGGATGAAVGAVTGSVGRGAAAGAAGGATHGLVRGLFTRNAPDPVTRAYVERCLRERNYDVIGWR